MSAQPIDDIDLENRIEEIAMRAATVLKSRLAYQDLLPLLQIVFLDVDQTAKLFDVKEKTIRAWVQQDCIPWRKANGKIVFLLAELLAWTLPEDDRHKQHRLVTARQCRIAAERATARAERSGL